MSETPAPATPESPAAAPTPPAADAAPAAPTIPAAQAAPEAPAKNVWEDPEAAKAEIEKLRKENGAARTNAKAQAAEEARKELAQTIGKALGLVADEPLDPAKLTESLTTAQEQAKQAQIELAVFRAAGDTADPAALLDSKTFLEKVSTIDPADSAAITAAIGEAVTQNPRLGKAVTPGMKPNPAQGRSASPPLGLDEQIAAAQKSGDMRAVMRLKAAQMVKNSTS